jgi:hypothetical protein
MNEVDVFSANKRIVDKIINDLRHLFDFFERRNMFACKAYIVYALEGFLSDIKNL